MYGKWSKWICLVSLATMRLALVDNDVRSVDTEIPKKESTHIRTCIHVTWKGIGLAQSHSHVCLPSATDQVSPDCMRRASSNRFCANKWLAVVYILHHVLDGGVINEDLLNIELRLLGDEVHASLSLFLLELEGDVSDGTLLDSLHQVSNETSDLVSESLGRNDGNLLSNLLVELEVKGELLIVLLNDVSSRSLDSLSSDSSH